MTIATAPSPASRIALSTTANIGTQATTSSGTTFNNSIGASPSGYGLGAAQMGAAGVVPGYSVASGGTASVGLAANEAGAYAGTLAVFRSGAPLDTVSWSFTTTGRATSMTLTPASQSTNISGTGSLVAELKDAAGNRTQPLWVDSVSLSSTGGTTTPASTVSATNLATGRATIAYAAPATAGSYTVTATPLGTLPGGGVTAQSAAITVSGSISTTAVTSISVSAPANNVAAGTDPTAATSAVPAGTSTVTVAVVGTASTTVRLAAFASTGTGTINGVAAGASLAAATTFVDVPLNAAGEGSTTFTLGGNLLATGNAFRVNQVQANNTTQVTGVQLTVTQTAPAISGATIIPSPRGAIVKALNASTNVTVTVVDQFSEPVSNATVRAYRTSTSGSLLSSGTTGAAGTASVTVSPLAGLTTGQSETYVFTAQPLAGTELQATATLVVTYTTSGDVTGLSVAVTGGATTPVTNATTSIATLPYMLVPYNGAVNVAATGVYTVATGAGTAGGNYATFTPTATPANTVTVTVPAGVKVATSLTGLTWSGGAQTASVATGSPVYVFATKTGEHEITFTSGSVTTKTKIKVDTAPAASYNIAVTPADQTIAAAGFGTVRVTVTDVFGNPVPGATGTNLGGVTLGVTGEVLFGGLTNTTNVTTNALGHADVTIIAGRAGKADIVAGPQGGAATTTPAWVAGYTPPTGAPAPVKAAAAKVTVQDSASKSLVISGGRTTVSGKNGIFVDGVADGFDNGAKVKPWVRFPGETAYAEGTARPEVTDEEFYWQRKTGKRIYVYFTSDDDAVRSNRIIIDVE